MTLLEELRNEGELEGLDEGDERYTKVFREVIEMAAAIRFPGDMDIVMSKVNKTDDLETLLEVTKTICITKDVSEIMALLK